MIKKILYLITQSEFGGAQQYILDLARYFNRSRYTRSNTQMDADSAEKEIDLLYKDITYKIRGACFSVWKKFGGSFKEMIVDNALTVELKNQGLLVENQKRIDVYYENEKVGYYVPDKIINNLVLMEIKCKFSLTFDDKKQFWYYLKASNYKLGLLINFGPRGVEIERRIYDKAREGDRGGWTRINAENDIRGNLRQTPRESASTEYEVMVAAGENERAELFNKLQQNGIRSRFLKNIKRQINPWWDFLALLEIISLLKKEKPDVLHLNSTKVGVLGSLAVKIFRVYQLLFLCKSTSIKTVYTVHGFILNEPLDPIIKAIYWLAELVSFALTDKIICVSEFDRQSILRAKLTQPKKLITIHNGLDINQLNFLNSAEAKKQLGIFDNNKIVIGTLANFYNTKGLKYFIAAIALLAKTQPNIVGVIIGDGELRPQLEKQIKALALIDKIILAGQKANGWKYLPAFDVYVCSSVKEGFPYSLLEAQAAGLPIISTDVGGIPEIITDRQNGLLVAAVSAEQLAAKIELLIKDRQLGNQLKSAAKLAAQKFNLDNMLQRTKNIYNSQVGNR